MPPSIPSVRTVTVDDELLVYHASTFRAFSLNPVSRLIFEACDGVTPRSAVAARLEEAVGRPGAGLDLLHLGLAELEKAGLLESPAAVPVPRRAALKLALGLAALPGMVGLSLPAQSAVLSCVDADAGGCTVPCLPCQNNEIPCSSSTFCGQFRQIASISEDCAFDTLFGGVRCAEEGIGSAQDCCQAKCDAFCQSCPGDFESCLGGFYTCCDCPSSCPPCICS